VKLLTGTEFIREGRFLVVIAYFPSTSSFTPSQLKPFIPRHGKAMSDSVPAFGGQPLGFNRSAPQAL
jgi:hypothetical protein